MKCNAGLTNQVEVIQPQALLQSEEISEVHICNPNYKGKNYDPNFQAKCAEATHPTPHNSKQQQHSSTMANKYKTAYSKPASTYGARNNNTPLTSSLDIVGEVTLKTSLDGYQLLKVNKMIKNAVAWRARMPKMSKLGLGLVYYDTNFVSIVTENHSSSIYSSSICDSIGREGNSFLYYKNANFSNFKPALKAQAIGISRRYFYIRDPCLLRITYMSLFSDFIKY